MNEQYQEEKEVIASEQDESSEEQQIIEQELQQSDTTCPHKEGDILRFIRVRFPGHVNAQEFFIANKQFNYGQKVVAMSDRGMAVGYINSLVYERPFHPSLLPLKRISRVALQEDLEKEQEQHKKRKEAEKVFVDLSKRHQLDMTLTHVEFTQFGKNIVFYFNANNRIDFRQLLVDLRREFKLRIELRQISIRDRSAAMGGVGACGRALCCSSFLKDLGNTNIKMCKNQDIAIIPSKINGVCGQIKCCMRYENDTYNEKRDLLPEEGNFLATQNSDLGKVTKLHVLKEQFEMITDKGKIRRYALDQYDINHKVPENWTFPREFDVIYDERAQLVTLKVEEEVQVLTMDGEKIAPQTSHEPVDERSAQQQNNNRNNNHRRGPRN